LERPVKTAIITAIFIAITAAAFVLVLLNRAWEKILTIETIV
jgi:multisubunit Na+/H+ antiporter MnhC subunit